MPVTSGKENSNCCGSSNGYENDPRSLPARLVVVPFVPVPVVPTILLAWLDGPAEREVRGCPRMSPSRNNADDVSAMVIHRAADRSANPGDREDVPASNLDVAGPSRGS